MFWALILWVGMILSAGVALLVLAEALDRDSRQGLREDLNSPRGHKDPPHYSLDDWA